MCVGAGCMIISGNASAELYCEIINILEMRVALVWPWQHLLCLMRYLIVIVLLWLWWIPPHNESEKNLFCQNSWNCQLSKHCSLLSHKIVHLFPERLSERAECNKKWCLKTHIEMKYFWHEFNLYLKFDFYSIQLWWIFR